ncbi:hypothetical protein Btru_072285 [Bulinus truncatus]|nr:hypothetical protein Btru_072285 [Bulinus truncatus]
MREKNLRHLFRTEKFIKMFGLLKVSISVCLIVQVCCTEEECHPHNCVSGQAECVDNTTCACRSPPYTWGDGNFACYRHNQLAAEVKNDPVLTTFNNESVKFHDVCRYLLTSVKLELKKRGDVRIGFCYFNVHAFHRRIKGKIVVDGIEIAVKFEMGYHNVKTFSVITYGQADHVTLGGTDNEFLENGPYGHDLVYGPVIYSDPSHGLYVKRFYDPDNRQYVFQVENCGFKATFVPFDPIEGIRSRFIPGISVAISCVFYPQWLQTDKVMALPPSKNGSPTLASIAHHLQLTKEQAAVYRAFTRHVEQSQPHACSVCSNASKVFDTCNSTELTAAFDQCFWIMSTPVFIKCISPSYPNTSPRAHLSFFITCIDHYCDGFHRCDHLRATDCHHPQLSHILQSTCGYDW